MVKTVFSRFVSFIKQLIWLCQCVTSTFRSHFIGFICIIIAGWEYLMLNQSQLNDEAAWGHVIVTLYIYCAALCFLFSSIYHWYGCLSEDCNQLLLKIDLSGIALLISGSYIPGTYYGTFLV